MALFFCADLFNESNGLADNLFSIYKMCAIVLAMTAQATILRGEGRSYAHTSTKKVSKIND